MTQARVEGKQGKFKKKRSVLVATELNLRTHDRRRRSTSTKQCWFTHTACHYILVLLQLLLLQRTVKEAEGFGGRFEVHDPSIGRHHTQKQKEAHDALAVVDHKISVRSTVKLFQPVPSFRLSILLFFVLLILR